MSTDPLTPYASWYNANSPIFVKIPAQVSTLAVSSLTGNILSVNSTFSCNIQSVNAQTVDEVVTGSIYLDNQVLTATSTNLLFNGVPLASQGDTLSTIFSTISNWSLYPQTSTLQGNNQNIRGTNLLEAKNVNFSTLAGSNGTFINLFTQNLMAFNVVTFTSTFIDVYESTIQSDIKLANISTLNAREAYVSSANISSLYGNFASINTLTGGSATVSTLSVNSNTTTGSLTVIGGATVSNGLTVSNGANFSQGFGTSGLAYFNNQTICNLQTISNSNTTLNLIVDASTNTSVYPTINLQSKFGGGGIINITADQPSIFVLVPTQQVNIKARGGVGYATGIPVGGAISLVAEAGTSNSMTPTGVLANGAIRLTAYSFIAGAYTVPGLIQESAGSITAYAGLTSPTLGVYGCSFYSALTCLSLTCGASPAQTSFPGVVYLRGDNGTKVVNGFYADSINNNAGYDLNIASKTIDISNRNINIDSGFDLKLNSSNGGQVIINGSAYPPSSGAGVWCSTATTNLNMNGFSISSISNLYSAGNFNIFAPAGLGIGLNNNTYLASNTINDVGGINLVSAGYVNLSGGNISNVGNIFGSNLIITTGGNLQVKSSTGNVDVNCVAGAFLTLGNSGGGSYFQIQSGGAQILTTPTGQNITLTAGGNLVLTSPNQTYFDNGGFVQFNVDHIYMYRGYLDMATHNICNVQQITFLGGDITTGSNYLDIHGKGPGNYASLINGGSYYTIDTAGNCITYSSNISGVRANSNVYIQSDTSYIELVATGGTGTIYHTAGFTEFRGNAGFTSSNSYIGGLAHIYGNTYAPGGGLAMDYVYGLFFNSAGNNANLYASGGQLNMINYNGGTYIQNFNATGTGDMVLYNQNNPITIATGTGKDMALNSGRSIYFNSAQPDSVFSIYTSTLNATSLLDTNMSCQRNFNLTGGGSANYITITNAGTSIQFAGPNLYFTTTSGGANFNIPVAIGSAYSLNMNTAPITSCGDFSRRLIGADISQPIIQYSTITGTGNNGTVTVNIPQRYTSQTSYIPFANMMDDPPAQIFVSSISRGSFIIGWSSGGPGTHTFGWNTMGT